MPQPEKYVISFLVERRIPRPHAEIGEIVQKALRGDSFFVNRAALNGDLALLPNSFQRRIVAVANDKASRFAMEQIIATTMEQQKLNDEFIAKHLGLAVRVFFSAGSDSLQEQIEEFFG